MTHARWVTTTSVSLRGARAVIEGALQRAEEIGLQCSVAVVDRSGHLVSFDRVDGATLISSDLAIDKAYTAVSMGGSTDQLGQFIGSDPHLARSVPQLPRIRLFGGGVLLRTGGEIIGAVGVSGGHHTQDHDVATAGASAIQ